MRENWNGQLPDRYDRSRLDDFVGIVDDNLRPGMRVLDVGSGRHPTIPPEGRPPGCHYVGLDISPEELGLAPPGSYDETAICDVTERLDKFVDSFDLIISFQVFEHVRPLDRALDNLYSYLRPGGRLVIEMSGSFSVFGLADRALPEWARVQLLVRLLGREPEGIFPAYFHRCWYTALSNISEEWTERTITPIYRAAQYFAFSRALQTAFIGYEEWTVSRALRNLASYYRVIATR
jgi:SAM-dependent methyltransferase